MYKRLLNISHVKNKSFFLFGPRATGKTHWLKSQFSDAIYLDLLESELYTDLLARPMRLENLIPPDYDGWILIDEIQKVPQLLNEVHRLIEKCSFKFVMTGSSARSLRKMGSNLLAGRALTFQMYPLTTKELGNDFNLEFSLNYGHLPSLLTEEDPKLYLNSYVKTYLREEVAQEGLTRNLSAFNRFLEVASFSQGETLNMSEVAREVGVQRKIVESYFQILEDLLLAIRLPVFSRRAKRRLVAHPKFYFFDVGVYRSIRPTGPLDSPEEAEGAGFETLIFQELRAINDYLAFEYQMYYWRTSTGLEVDFILYGPKGIIAIEVKRSRSINRKDLRSLKAFADDYPDSKRMIFYGGNRIEYHDGIQAIPFEIALSKLPALLSLETIK
jgi:uncharacterized protein